MDPSQGAPSSKWYTFSKRLLLMLLMLLNSRCFCYLCSTAKRGSMPSSKGFCYTASPSWFRRFISSMSVSAGSGNQGTCGSWLVWTFLSCSLSCSSFSNFRMGIMTHGLYYCFRIYETSRAILQCGLNVWKYALVQSSLMLSRKCGIKYVQRKRWSSLVCVMSTLPDATLWSLLSVSLNRHPWY